MSEREFDPGLYGQVVSQPEGLRRPVYLKQLRVYVKAMTPEARALILARRDEIMEAFSEWKELNFLILTRLGFTEAEAELLKDKRLDSPGMRNVMRVRREEIANVKRQIAVVMGGRR